MARIAIMFLFVLVVNALFFVTQAAVNDIGGGAHTWYTYENSTLKSYDAGDYVVETDAESRLPDSDPTTTSSTGNVFTDTWGAIKGWWSKAVNGVKYIGTLASTVPNFLSSIGLPKELSFVLGVVWYAFSVIIMISFIRGNDI